MISSGQNKREKIAVPAGGGDANRPWYAGVTGYQWLILIIASAGWIFDVYEGQIFNITRGQLLHTVLGPAGTPAVISKWGDIFLGVFLLGGTAGGLLFGSMADRLGRKPTMVLTILMYSIFSGLTFFATTLWQVAALRFLVAMGVGGEWAVAASLVAEVFPANARTHASGIFHATSVVGTWAATGAGIAVASLWFSESIAHNLPSAFTNIGHAAPWRYAYLVGIIPALLVVVVMAAVKEPESWKRTKSAASLGGTKGGSIKELLSDPRWGKRALLGMLLAAVGLGTFWAVCVAGQDLAKFFLLRDGVAEKEAVATSQSAYGFIQTIGGGLGLLSFGPLCAKFGRKRSFVAIQIAAFIIVPITCYLPQNYGQLKIILPIFGFLTLGMHAGYAIYFPELFPTHLRATGAGFCFNVGRTVAASMLFFSGWLKQQIPDIRLALTLLSFLFLLGVVVIHYLPETKDQPLPE